MRNIFLVLVTIATVFLLVLPTALNAVVISSQEKDTIVILTPHWSGIRKVAEADFKEWYRKRTGRDIEIEWEYHDTVECLRLVREAGGEPGKVKWDVWWGGGLDAFMIAEEEDLLEPFYLPDDPEWIEINKSIPAKLFGLPLKDMTPEHGKYCWWGTALSGFGIMYNKKYLERYDLPVPSDWLDLAKPLYRGHLTMTPPSKSGSNHMIVEIILQYYGWERGWEILISMGRNMKKFTEKSYEVPPLVAKGEVGIAPVIDFYAFGQIAAHGPEVIGFHYPPAEAVVKHTIINPDSAAILKNAPHKKEAIMFMKFLLSIDGQKMLFKDPINRLPVRPDVYVYAPPGYFNPFTTELTLITYDDEKGSARWEVVNDLYDILIVYRHAELIEAFDAIESARAKIDEYRREGIATLPLELALDTLYRELVEVPVSEEWAVIYGPEYARNSTLQAKLRAEWDSYAKEKYARIKSQVAELIKAYDDMIALKKKMSEYENEIARLREDIASLEEQLRAGPPIQPIMMAIPLIVGLVIGLALGFVIGARRRS
ncbi:MAG: hypothetical protein DRN15_00500 [Thermoprotei archaeon]|nr:MAG: hypothetical protein DRN15_00500 [Thermoprotei archaeon]